ncbi:MAG: hypothetical protein HY275_07840 [Gemmatimonadetes bacterium]|nr:hypothetical protein [Gemmatimonadota bacterium]
MRPSPAPGAPLSRRSVVQQMGAMTVIAALPARAAAARVTAGAAPSLDVERLLRLARVPSLSMAVSDGGRVTTTS